MPALAPTSAPATRAGQVSALFALRSWFIPDVALVAAFAMLICLFMNAGGGSALFRDSDAGWHIRNGERIVLTHSLPYADPFSFSKPGALWIAWEWGSDAVTGAVHLASGLGGVAVLYGLGIAASVWMWFRLTWAVEGNFLLACVLVAPAISTSTIHWLARPHIWGWLFALGSVWWCEGTKAPRKLTWQHLALVAVFSALWANMHASFVLGPAIALIYAAGSYLRRMVWNEQAGNRAYIAAATTAILATLLNPQGWNLHRHVWDYLSDSALIARIGEFQSFDFHSRGAVPVMIVMFTGLAGGIAGLAIRRPERFLLSLLITAAALRSARAVPLAALLLIPLAAGSITEVLAYARGLEPRLRKNLDNSLRYGERLRAWDRGFNGFALVPVVASILFAAMRVNAEFPAARFPVAASQVIALLPDQTRLFATDYYGGYLIYRFRGERKVFFDGRSDFYGADFVDRYSRMIEARPGWREEFKRWHFTHALLPADSALLEALENSGWHELHRDRTAVLLAAEGGN